MKQKTIGILAVIIVLSMGCSQEKSYIDRGLRQLDRGNFKSAIWNFDKAIAINPQSACSYYFRGLVYQKLNKEDQAISDYTKALSIDNEFKNAYINRGALLHKNKNYSDAIKDLDRVIQLNPSDIKAYIARADIFYDQGKFNDAISDYNTALSLNKDNARAYLSRGDAFYKKKDYENAIMDYERSLKLDPRLKEAYNNYAFLLSSCSDGKYRDGRKALELVSELLKLKRSSDLLDTASIVYAELGDFGRAVDLIQEAISLEKDEKKIVKFKARLELYKQSKPYRE